MVEYIKEYIKDFLIFNQQYDVLSLMNQCGCKLKKYIDLIWSHKEYRVLCTRFDRKGGTRVEQFFSSIGVTS